MVETRLAAGWLVYLGAVPPWLKTLYPGYPALVMATGIVAVACEQQGITVAARALYVVAAVAFVVLAILFILRAIAFPRAFADDLTHHATGFTMLTLVAATSVVGAASAVVHGWWDLASVLWWVSLPLLAVFLYVPLIAGILRQETSDFRTGINGSWFLMTVAIESVAVLGALILGHRQHDLLAFAAVGAFGLGLLLYVVVMTLTFARWVFTRVEPDEIHPPAWIAAGAVAITTLAGSNLVAAAPHVERLERLIPFLEGVTMLTWATATFWFPVMIAIGVWRHLIHRIPLEYSPAYWSMVFPLGMYSAATFAMLPTFQLENLDWLPKIALVIAGIAWLAVAAGLVRSMRNRHSGSNPEPTASPRR